MQNYCFSRQKRLTLHPFPLKTMFKSIVNTLITKFSAALFGFLTLIIVSRALGSGGKGEQAMLIYNIYVLLLIFTLIGNSTLIYLTPRKKTPELLTVSLLWILITAVTLSLFALLLPANTLPHLQASIWIGAMAAISEVNQYILLGKQQITQANTLKILYPLLSFLYLLILYITSRFDTIQDCIQAIALAYTASLLYGTAKLRHEYLQIRRQTPHRLFQTLKTLLQLGVTKQAGTIAQSLNYRLSYYIIGYTCGTSLVGIYSNAVSLSESVMLFGTSLALVQYSTLSNNPDDRKSKRITWKMTLANALFTLLALLLLALLPKEIYTHLFGNDFQDTGITIGKLAFGTLMLSLSSNFSQYLYSRGNFKISTAASLLGLAVTLLAGLRLIPRYGLNGAIITATASYITTFAIEFYGFLKYRKPRI